MHDVIVIVYQSFTSRKKEKKHKKIKIFEYIYFIRIKFHSHEK